MKILTSLILAFALSSAASELPNNFLVALNKVEASGRTNNVPPGDNGHAIGPFQIHKKYWQDSGVEGKYKDCFDYAYSVRVVTAYLKRYGDKYIESNNFEALARIHNGGPTGYKKDQTLEYWRKVKHVLK